MVPHVKNVPARLDDQVAIERGRAKLMGFDPMADCKFVRLGTNKGWASAIPRIELVGDLDAGRENWHFEGPLQGVTFAARNQHGLLGALEETVEWFAQDVARAVGYIASVVYHDLFGIRDFAKQNMARDPREPWGRLFANWGNVRKTIAGCGGGSAQSRADRDWRQALREGCASWGWPSRNRPRCARASARRGPTGSETTG